MAKLYFYYSSMNAGKSTMLLQSAHNYHERGMRTLLFAPALDDRYGVGNITSRIGLTTKAIPFDANTDLYEYCKEQQKQIGSKLKCILLDEAQFLSQCQVEQLTEVTTQLSIPVLCYGLRADFQGEPFEGSKYLLAWAEELIEIKTICHCGRKATMNMRLDENNRVVREGEQILIGGNDSYIAVCLKHYKTGQVLSEESEIA